MKKSFFVLVLIGISLLTRAADKPFRFAFVTDTHIGSPNGSAEEDLRRTVRDINSRNDIAFVVLTGDITELGTNDELKLAKQILDSLNVPWYIIPGNHDTGWSESGGEMFTTVFGHDRFSFDHHGIRFLACASGPYLRMSDGHVPRDAVNWLDQELKKLDVSQPVIFLNHYPVDNSLDNWYEITDRLRRYNTQAILCGHGHANKVMNFEDIPGVMGRSNLRAKDQEGGYNIVDVRNDSIIFTVRRPVSGHEKKWASIKTRSQHFESGTSFARPDYTINSTWSIVARQWEHLSDANIISTPAVDGKRIYTGSQNGTMTCMQLQTGKLLWKQNTGSAIFSSPAVSGNRLFFGTAKGTIYCIDTRNGKTKWEKQMGAAVLGSPLLHGDTLFIGASDGSFIALHKNSGQSIWQFKGLKGPVVSTPLLADGRLVFGAWDRYLYALNSSNGAMLWKWSNGSPIRNYSPAACTPVAAGGVVYVVAPDRNISAIDLENGKTLWRSNEAAVRESIGISENRQWVYGKTMQDTIVAFSTGREKNPAAWKLHVGFGYEHVPSMLVEKDGLLYFGTRNGVVYCINPVARLVVWAHKIDNSMVNTVRVMGKGKLLAATMDGKIVLLQIRPGG